MCNFNLTRMKTWDSI